jgi:ankyrin repeat protein
MTKIKNSHPILTPYTLNISSSLEEEFTQLTQIIKTFDPTQDIRLPRNLKKKIDLRQPLLEVISIAFSRKLSELKTKKPTTPTINYSEEAGDPLYSLIHFLLTTKLHFTKFPLNQYLLLGNSPTSLGVTPLYIACKRNLTDIATLLITSTKIKLDKGCVNLQSPLYAAAQKGNLSLVDRLLSAGADPNCLDHQIETPLHASLQHPEIVRRLLLEPKLKINFMSGEQRTPLMSAAEYGYSTSIQILLQDKRTDPNRKTNTGYTALYLAVEEGHLQAVKLILSHKKTNIQKSTRSGLTPLNIATIENHEKITALLLKTLCDSVKISKKNLLHDISLAFDLALLKENKKMLRIFLKDTQFNVHYKTIIDSRKEINPIKSLYDKKKVGFPKIDFSLCLPIQVRQRLGRSIDL